jgi:hypothetical protein
MNPDPQGMPPLENLLLAALYLATNFSKTGCPRLSHMILHQLEFVLKHPRKDLSPMIHETCQRLHEVWAGIHAERSLALADDNTPEVIRRVH